ncbi:MAG: hypothetical protein NXI24_14340 [bacterium]|nr:hypothetical protein [bacterium]
MYILNDGKRLELSLNASTNFASDGERRTALASIRDAGLPVHVRWKKQRRPSPVEAHFLSEIIQTVRSSGGRIRIHGSTSIAAAI